jgi:hypothetical protein
MILSYTNNILLIDTSNTRILVDFLRLSLFLIWQQPNLPTNYGFKLISKAIISCITNVGFLIAHSLQRNGDNYHFKFQKKLNLLLLIQENELHIDFRQNSTV